MNYRLLLQIFFAVLSFGLLAGCGGGSDTGTDGGVTYAKAILKLGINGTLPSGSTIGGWGVTVKLPASATVARVSGSNALASTAYYASGVTPSGVTLQGSFNPADASSTTPYLKLASLGNTASPTTGTGIGEVATIVIDLGSGAAPTAGDFVLLEEVIAQAAVGAPQLTGVNFTTTMTLQ